MTLTGFLHVNGGRIEGTFESTLGDNFVHFTSKDGTFKSMIRKDLLHLNNSEELGCFTDDS